MSDATIVDCASAAYLRHGFTGLVGWHYYNEPTLAIDRVLRLMREIKAKAPQARFILWSNGTQPQPQKVLDRFDRVHITDYSRSPYGENLDERLQDHKAQGDRPCLRIWTEFVLDYFGQHHPCCFDWRGRASLGNVLMDGFDTLIARWAKMQEAVGGRHMTDYAPPACLDCGWRTSAITQFDQKAARRAQEWRQGLC